MGSIFTRGKIRWIKYSDVNGRIHRESSHSKKITVAQRLLNKREGEKAEGKLPGIYFDKVTLDELAEDFLTDYQVNGRDTLDKAKIFVRHLSDFFGGMKAVSIGTGNIRSYTAKRMEDGMANASINRELSALKRMFHLAYQCTPPKVQLIPYIPMLKENNVRKGFFEYEDYVAVRDNADGHFQPVIIWGYFTGCRIMEILNLRMEKVDRFRCIARFEDTKNEEDREVDFSGIPELRRIVENRFKEKVGCPWVFHRNGQKFTEHTYAIAWTKACIKAGFYKEVIRKDGQKVKMVSRLFHDFRRTALRNMDRANVPETVAIKISGHKTRSVYDRYNITSSRDLKEASKRIGAYYEKQAGRGAVVRFPVQQQLQNE